MVSTIILNVNRIPTLQYIRFDDVIYLSLLIFFDQNVVKTNKNSFYVDVLLCNINGKKTIQFTFGCVKICHPDDIYSGVLAVRHKVRHCQWRLFTVHN